MSCFLADEQNKEAGQLRDRHQQLGRRSGSNKKKNTNTSKSSSSQGKASHEYPTEFYCPISHCLMLEPVMDREGNTYERTSIEQWLSKHNTSPITRNSLNANHLVVNRALVGLMGLEFKRSGDQPELEKRKAWQKQKERKEKEHKEKERKKKEKQKEAAIWEEAHRAKITCHDCKDLLFCGSESRSRKCDACGDKKYCCDCCSKCGACEEMFCPDCQDFVWAGDTSHCPSCAPSLDSWDY